MDINDSYSKKIVALLESMSDIINKYKRYMKPREADKARQARLMLKKLKKLSKYERRKHEANP